MNAHILVFECPNCGRPMPFIRLDERIRYPNIEQEVERVELGCFGADCGWSTRLRLKQRGSVQRLNGLTSNQRALTRTKSHPPLINPDCEPPEDCQRLTWPIYAASLRCTRLWWRL